MANHEEENTCDANPNPPSLPENIIYEIFTRLPAESLSDLHDDCKYLAKRKNVYDYESWKSLISSPHFIKAHLSRSTNDPHLTHHRLLLITWPYVEQANPRYMKLSSCSVHSLLNSDDTVPETIENYHPARDDTIHVVGYCNGLFCLTSSLTSDDEIEIFLWNPFTSSSTKLPKHEHGHRAHGFCYDESNDDYKVFAISSPGDQHEYNVSVYSSKSGCWKIIGDYFYGEIYGRGKFANGDIHSSLVRRKNMQPNNPESYIIVSINIKIETSREVSLPPKGEGKSCTTLETFGQSLAIMYYYFQTGVDFWVMNEWGVDESWTKLFTIPFRIGLPCYSWIKPLCVSVNGDKMLLSGSTIVLYSPKDNTFKNLLSTEYGDDTLYVHPYVESLVSPPKLASRTKLE